MAGTHGIHMIHMTQAVIELGRKIRERATRPVKFPLRKLIVVHPDQAFLDDVKGGCGAGY